MTHTSESMTARWASPWGAERRRVLAARRAATEARYQAEHDARAIEREAAALERRRVAADAEAARRRALPPKTTGRWATVYAAPPARHPQAIRRDREAFQKWIDRGYPWGHREVAVPASCSRGASTASPAGVLAGIPSAVRF